MLKLLCGLAALSALAAAVALAPVRGRTVLDRWNAARTPGEFAERAYQEARGALGLAPEKPRPARQAARPAQPAPRAARPARPTEHHTEEDRAALDRIVAEHTRR
jgi:hypothetical protein